MTLNRRRNIPKKKSKTVAAIMALLGGTFGIHKFYLGQGGAGVFFVFLFISSIQILNLPISTLLGIFDAIRLLSMSNLEFDQKYNKAFIKYYEQNKNKPYAQTPTRRQTKKRTSVGKRVNPYKRAGIIKYKDFDLDGAIEEFKKGLEIEPDDVALHWNLACAYSLSEEIDETLYHLDKAVRYGYNDFDKINTHDDLAFARIQPTFQSFKDNGYRLGQNSGISSDKSIVKDDLLLAQLNKLSELRKKGILTEAEFSLEKEKLLNRP